MINVDKAVFARLNKKGKEFEILVDPNLVGKAREDLIKGKDVDLSLVLAVEDIFFDSKKGIRAGKKDLMPAFDTSDVIEIAKIIIKEGKINTSSENRTKETQDKWDRLAALISMNAVDPQTKKPIPRKVIEDALHKSMHKVDSRKVDDQLPDAIKAVKKIIPLSFEQRTLQINNIAANLVTPCLNTCKNLGTITKENWNADRSLTLIVSVPASLREELIDKLNALTKGNADIKVID